MEIVDIKKLREIMNGSKKPHAVVLVFSNNCGHCTSMMPEWHRLEKQVKHDKSLKTNPRCYLSKVESHNASMIPEIDPESIRGVPTIKFLNKGMLEADYEESGKSRTAEDMLEWIRSKVKDDNVNMHIMEPSTSDDEASRKSGSDHDENDGESIHSAYNMIKEFSLQMQSNNDDGDIQEEDDNVNVIKKAKTRRRRRQTGNRKGKKPTRGRKQEINNRKPRKGKKPKGRQSGGWIASPRTRSKKTSQTKKTSQMKKPSPTKRKKGKSKQ